MSSKLTGATIAVVGGDDREVVLVRELLKMGADVRVAGISKLSGNKSVKCCESLSEAVKDVRFIILPMPGVDENGIVRARYGSETLRLDAEILKQVRDDSVLIVGFARPLLKEMVADRGIKLIEIAEMDHVAILNSIPSAEGAIQMAMEATDITIHGSNVAVIGAGRCGLTLARMAAGIGAKTSVVARKPADLARIREMGIEAVTYEQFSRCIDSADIIFNTVPYLVLTRNLLMKANKEVFICDIASAPGGVDFSAAQELGIKAVLAPGLPGKVAPKTAGLILAEVIPELIADELRDTSSLSDIGLGSRGC